jgi:hypothetical protein
MTTCPFTPRGTTILAALIAVLTLVACVAGFASSAWAECAWVL